MQLKPPATLRLPGIYVWPPPWVKRPSPGGWDLTVSNGSGKSSRLRELAATCAFSNFVSARPLLKLQNIMFLQVRQSKIVAYDLSNQAF